MDELPFGRAATSTGASCPDLHSVSLRSGWVGGGGRRGQGRQGGREGGMNNMRGQKNKQTQKRIAQQQRLHSITISSLCPNHRSSLFHHQKSRSSSIQRPPTSSPSHPPSLHSFSAPRRGCLFLHARRDDGVLILKDGRWKLWVRLVAYLGFRCKNKTRGWARRKLNTHV